MEWGKWINKRVFVKLNSGNVFNGKVTEVNLIGLEENGIEINMIGLIDKFGYFVAFKDNDIIVIKEEGQE